MNKSLMSSLIMCFVCLDNTGIDTAETAVNALNFDTSAEFREVMEKLIWMAFLWK